MIGADVSATVTGTNCAVAFGAIVEETSGIDAAAWVRLTVIVALLSSLMLMVKLRGKDATGAGAGGGAGAGTGTEGGPLAGGPAASVNGEFVPPIKNPLFTEEGLLDPGEKVEGRVNFDLQIPFGEDPTLDLSGFELELGDGDPTAQEEKSVDLGL